MFWDSAFFEIKLKSSTNVKKSSFFFYSAGFQLCIICSCLATGVKEVEEDF